MNEILYFFAPETIACLSLVPLGMFFLIKSISQNKKKELIYTILTVVVLLVVFVLLIKCLKDII